MKKKPVKLGDQVKTPDGVGAVRGIDEQTTYQFRKPHRHLWLMVELDNDRGHIRRYDPAEVEDAD